MLQSEIIAGKGKGRCCDISIYVMPQGATKEYFEKYSKEGIKTLKENNTMKDGDTIKNDGGRI